MVVPGTLVLLAAAQAAKCLPSEAMRRRRKPRRVKPKYYLYIEKGPRIFVRGLFLLYCVVDRLLQQWYYEFIDIDSTISRIAEKSLLSTTGSCTFFEKVIG